MSCDPSNGPQPRTVRVGRCGTSCTARWASAARRMARGSPAGYRCPLRQRACRIGQRERERLSMATTAETSNAELQELAKRHLWMHFSRMGAYENGAEVPIIVRGDGCYVWDQHGKKYLDGLSSLFCTNIGHGRAEVAQAGADQAKELDFFTNWSYAHPRAIELAARVADLAPGDLNRVFFSTAASERWGRGIKPARQYHKVTGNPNKTKIVAREIAYHGTTLGAL